MRDLRSPKSWIAWWYHRHHRNKKVTLFNCTEGRPRKSWPMEKAEINWIHQAIKRDECNLLEETYTHYGVPINLLLRLVIVYIIT